MIKQFFKPTSIEEAMLIKEKYGDAITWFAGGVHINHAFFLAGYDKVIALEGLGLHAIHSKNERISIGATVTLQKLIDNSLVPKPLRKAAFQAANRTMRNMATVGGDIAMGRRKSALLPCLLALGATIATFDNNAMPIETYIQSGNRDLILKVYLPEKIPSCCIGEYTQKASAQALIRVATSVARSTSGKLESVKLAVGTIENGSPRRLTTVENLVKENAALDLTSLAKAVSENIQPEADILGSVAFKKYVAGVTVADCFARCLEKE